MRSRFFFRQGSRTASLVLPIETILPPRQSTAPSSMMESSFKAGPRRGPGNMSGALRVSNWPMLTSSRGGDFRGLTLLGTLTLPSLAATGETRPATGALPSTPNGTFFIFENRPGGLEDEIGNCRLTAHQANA